MWQYPSSDLDRGRKLLGLLGSFWSGLYDGRDVVQKLCEARAEVEQQNWLNLMEAVRSFSRYEVPIFHKRNWHLWVIKQSEWDGDVWEGPPGLDSAPAITNRLADPSVVLTSGTDYFVTLASDGSGDCRVEFASDPFDNPLWGTRPVFDADGNQSDTELFLWVFRGDFDLKQVYDHWGYVLGLSLQSSEAYRDLLNSIFDAVAGGTGLREIQLAFAAMTGLPLAQGGETVEQVVEDARGKVVVTEKGAYRLPPKAALGVAVGDALTPGQSLTPDLQFAELNRGQVPSWVRALSLGRGFLVGRFHSDLVFDNRDLPTTVTTGDDGYTRIEFPVGGFPLDVEVFWDMVHEGGKARGDTLAELLDSRTNKEGQPGPSNLPAAINPVKFLCENVLRNNATLVRVKMSGIAPGAIGLSPARLLRKIVPPGSALLVLIEVSPEADSVILNVSPTAESPGGTHAISSFSGAETVSETIGEASLPARASAWKVSGTCQ